MAVDLRPYQQTDLDQLESHDRFAVWDEAGLGKTRPLLLAAAKKAGGRPILVVAPGAVRDTRVWAREAARIGVEPPKVISYHQAISGLPSGYPVKILDEAHRVKERKTSWVEPIYNAAWHSETEVLYEATGTPMPNGAFELWSQLRMMRPRDRAMQYYWPWVKQWFQEAPTRYNSFNYSDKLLYCNCYTDDGHQSESCKHWQEFYEANIAGYAVRHLRDDVLTDLPPLDGHEDPLYTPMTTEQRRLYATMKKDFLGQIPESGITLEALNDADQFTKLHQLSSGLSVLDPTADPKHRQSGKLNWLREHLRYVDKPVLVVVWFKNSARAVGAVCDELKVGWRAMGAKTGSFDRGDIVEQFGAGALPVLIASLSVIKEGVDGLQYGSDEVDMFERSWVPGDNEQTIRRLHRLGQTRPVTARQLVTPNTVDNGQWEDVQSKASRIGRTLTPVEVATMLAA